MSWVLLIIFGGVMARKGELGDEPNYYPKVNPNPNNIEELTVQDIPMYFDMFNRFYEIDYKPNGNLNRSYEKFTDNVKRIIIMNKFSTAAKFAINEFSHLTLEEFIDKYTGFNDTGLNSSDASSFIDNSTQKAPENLDWRALGMPTLVSHQGPCKSSYVFSAVAYIESQIATHFKVTLRLSEQQAYDCEKTGSCKYGGLPHKVMEALKDVGGIEEQTAYVYDPQDQRECKVKEHLLAVKVNTVQRYHPMYENDLIALLAVHGPIVTTIYVSESVKNYHKGVLWPTDCDKKPNHAVLLVGYGITDDSVPFWIIKNSWGMLWGESGYIRLIRGEHACNIGQYVATATVEPIYKEGFVATTRIERNYKKDKAVRAQDELPLTGFLNNVAGALFSLITPTTIKSTIAQPSPDIITEKAENEPAQPSPDTTTEKAENEPITTSTPVISYEEKETTQETTKKMQVLYELKKSHSAFNVDDEYDVDEVSDRKPIARKKSSSVSSVSSSSSESQEKYLKKKKIIEKKKVSEEVETSDSASLDSDDVAYPTKPSLRVTQV